MGALLSIKNDRLDQEAPAASDAPAAEGEGQLRIAWQYRRYIRRQQAEREAAARSNPNPASARSPGTSFVRKGTSTGPDCNPSSVASSGKLGRERSAASAAPSGGSSGSGGSGRAGAGDAGAARRWCHDFDLTRPMAEEALRGAQVVCLANNDF